MVFRKGSASTDVPVDQDTMDAGRWGALMARAQDGSQHDYLALLEGITPHVRGLCRRHLGRDEEIEDVVQDILLTLHSIRHTYERHRPFKPWLHTIASRRIADWMRLRARRMRLEDDGAGRALFPGDGLAGPVDAQPDRAAMRTSAAREVLHAIDALPPRQREAVVLLHLRGLTLKEASRATKQSAGALKVACHRALKSLQLVFRRTSQ